MGRLQVTKVPSSWLGWHVCLETFSSASWSGRKPHRTSTSIGKYVKKISQILVVAFSLPLVTTTSSSRESKPVICSWMTAHMPSGEHQGTFLPWLDISFALKDRYILEKSCMKSQSCRNIPFTFYLSRTGINKKVSLWKLGKITARKLTKKQLQNAFKKKGTRVPCKIPMVGLWRDLLDPVAAFSLGNFWPQWIVQIEKALPVLQLCQQKIRWTAAISYSKVLLHHAVIHMI